MYSTPINSSFYPVPTSRNLTASQQIQPPVGGAIERYAIAVVNLKLEKYKII